MAKAKRVLMISPGYPTEINYFTRGLAVHGAQVFGIGDQPAGELPMIVRQHLAGYAQVASLLDDDAVIRQVKAWKEAQPLDQVECLWEPGVILAAKLREALKLPGQDVAQATLFRDKDAMKQAVAAAGIRVPKHRRAATPSECHQAAEAIGYPIIIKPIAGAGSADTFRVNSRWELDAVLSRIGHHREVNIEEFIEADEYTYDTICIDGKIVYWNMCLYRPRPLTARQEEWISPQTIALRDVDDPYYAGARAMGPAVLKALGFRTGFTHMEWYRKADGEVVFGEIAARPPGARTVDIMNYASDIDLYTGWAEAALHGTFTQKLNRKYNCAIIFKRARGAGTIHHIAGLDELRRRYGRGIVAEELLPVGAQRRNWILTLVSDGFLVVRDPDFRKTCEMADAVGTDLQLYAG
jgi:formate-dependent phosphoribosylglycinamide formyltransferase (GAR transformylase)